MEQVIVPSDVSRALSDVRQQVLFCDARGRALGFFSPLPDGYQIDDLQLEPPLSRAETEELRKNRTGRPLEEILDRLGLS
jgi:hypothetical protein